jgi:hypothetical protein
VGFNSGIKGLNMPTYAKRLIFGFVKIQLKIRSVLQVHESKEVGSQSMESSGHDAKMIEGLFASINP